MKTYKFRNTTGDVKIEIDAETEDEAYLILVYTIKKVDDFYSTFD